MANIEGTVYDPATNLGLPGSPLVYYFDLAIEVALGNDSCLNPDPETTPPTCGTFSIPEAVPPQDGYLYCHGLQSTVTDPDGLSGNFYPFTHMPRMFKYVAGQSPIFLGSPACKTIAMIGYDKNGNLIRMGGHGWAMVTTLFDVGGKFNRPWATDLDGNTVEQSLSAIDDDYSKGIYQPDPELPDYLVDTFQAKIPCISVPVDATAMKLNWWSWPVYDALGDRAKLALSMDNGGVGFDAPSGDCLFVFVNKEICRTLLDRLVANKSRYSNEFQDSIDALVVAYGEVSGSTLWSALASQYDAILLDAILLEESAEQSLIDDRIEENRIGTLNVTVKDKRGNVVTCPMTAVAQQRQTGREFTFGVFPGTNGQPISSGYVSALVNLGFSYATFLFSWFWHVYITNLTDNPPPLEHPEYAALLHPTQADWNYTTTNEAAIKSVWGFDTFKAAGFDVKAHAVAYNQTFQIPPLWYLPTTGNISGWWMDPPENTVPMPNYGNGKTHAQTTGDLVTWGARTITAFGEYIDIIETCNEVAYTNVLNLTSVEKQALTDASTNSLAAFDKPLLVNSASTTIQWWEYFLWNVATAIDGGDCTPEMYGHMPMTYRQYLDSIQSLTMDKIAVIGLQWYPGSFVDWGQWLGYASVFEGAGQPPAEIYRELDRYAGYGKDLHITEFSVPAESDGRTPVWKNGYWNEVWGVGYDTPQWTPDAWADYVELCYRYAFSHPNCKSLTYWDPIDAGTGFNPANVNGGLMNSDLTLKAAGTRVKSLIESYTTRATPTIEAGVLTFEGYGGDYDLTLTMPTGHTETFRVNLKERATTDVTVTVKGATAATSCLLRRLCQLKGMR